jgi:hypothetical protein
MFCSPRDGYWDHGRPVQQVHFRNLQRGKVNRLCKKAPLRETVLVDCRLRLRLAKLGTQRVSKGEQSLPERETAQEEFGRDLQRTGWISLLVQRHSIRTVQENGAVEQNVEHVVDGLMLVVQLLADVLPCRAIEESRLVAADRVVDLRSHVRRTADIL